MKMNVGLLAVRVVVGLILAGHGSQKLFGWSGGGGVAGTGKFLESLGFRPGRSLAVLAGLSEFVGGLLLALGFLTPLAGAAIVGMMVNAIFATRLGKGPWAMNGGWELELTYAVVAAATPFTGPGRYSVDRAFGWMLAGNGWGVAATLVGIGVAVVILGVRAAARGREGVGSELRQAA
jgi:putative oxidoreductase